MHHSDFVTLMMHHNTTLFDLVGNSIDSGLILAFHSSLLFISFTRRSTPSCACFCSADFIEFMQTNFAHVSEQEFCQTVVGRSEEEEEEEDEPEYGYEF
jgi:hypothetical protein